MSEWLVNRVAALEHAVPDQQARTDHEMIAALYAAVTELERLMYEARRHQIEATLNIRYDRGLDADRPDVVTVQLKVEKLLEE